tara:strand:+ start:1365 stop:1997 length:633 start_codon:yes stop_codon:yes gene_type:complete
LGKLFSFLFAVLVVTTVSVSSQQLDQILAVVSGQVILRSDVRAFLELDLVDKIESSEPIEADQYYVTKLIERKLALDEANRYRTSMPASEEVEEEIGVIQGRLGGELALSEFLLSVGLGLSDLRQILQDNIRIERYVSERFGDASQLRESDLVSYFSENRDFFTVSGRTVEFNEVREVVRSRLWSEQRELLVKEWLTDLTRRGEVVRFEP